MEVLKRFLESEIMYQDLYDDIIAFITSFHVRNGEFEGNEFIIKKMDHLNFIIFPEDIYKDGKREISFAMSIYKNNLLKEINNHAIKQGILVKEE